MVDSLMSVNELKREIERTEVELGLSRRLLDTLTKEKEKEYKEYASIERAPSIKRVVDAFSFKLAGGINPAERKKREEAEYLEALRREGVQRDIVSKQEDRLSELKRLLQDQLSHATVEKDTNLVSSESQATVPAGRLFERKSELPVSLDNSNTAKIDPFTLPPLDNGRVTEAVKPLHINKPRLHRPDPISSNAPLNTSQSSTPPSLPLQMKQAEMSETVIPPLYDMQGRVISTGNDTDLQTPPGTPAKPVDARDSMNSNQFMVAGSSTSPSLAPGSLSQTPALSQNQEHDASGKFPSPTHPEAKGGSSPRVSPGPPPVPPKRPQPTDQGTSLSLVPRRSPTPNSMTRFSVPNNHVPPVSFSSAISASETTLSLGSVPPNLSAPSFPVPGSDTPWVPFSNGASRQISVSETPSPSFPEPYGFSNNYLPSSSQQGSGGFIMPVPDFNRGHALSFPDTDQDRSSGTYHWGNQTYRHSNEQWGGGY